MTKKVLTIIGTVLLVALGGYLLWRFSGLLINIIIATVVSFLGQPLVRLFSKIKIRKWKLPYAVSSFLAIVVILLIFIGFFAIFVPLIIQQAHSISQIDTNQLTAYLEKPLAWLNAELHNLGMLPNGQTAEMFVVEHLRTFFNFANVSSIVTNVFTTAGSLMVSLFTILFCTFFFLKDENMFENLLLSVLPRKHHISTQKVIAETKVSLMRYFRGILLELLGMMTLISIGLFCFGIDNALLLGFCGGLLNIIPYLGPAIGTTLGVIIGVINVLATGMYDDAFSVGLKIAGTFIISNFIDNMVLQPLIYSKAAEAHPLEIFFVIIIGGTLAGALGMIAAVPAYTVLKIIYREFIGKIYFQKQGSGVDTP